jgi:organic hydroperoxide reductase OsmC/OhrA
MPMRPKVFRHSGALEADGTILAEGTAPLDLPETWTSEHLLLAALARCTAKSLRYHAGDLEMTASATTSSTITRREEDGLYGLVEVDVEIDVALEPEPAPEQLRELLERAVRSCFIGNSLSVHPTYRWRVNGREVKAAP